MVYPSYRQFFSLTEAKKAAREDKREFGSGRVENGDTSKTLYRA
jgi:hypothetical protein